MLYKQCKTTETAPNKSNKHNFDSKNSLIMNCIKGVVKVMTTTQTRTNFITNKNQSQKIDFYRIAAK